jgi:methylmalonyl-CoA/ethylmalonyl-CoA epimerase
MAIKERSQPSSETESSTNPISSMQADHVFIGVDDYEKIKQWYIEKLDFTVDLKWTVDELPGMKLGYLCKGDFRTI